MREDELRDLERFAHAQPTDAEGRHRPVLALRHGCLRAQNCVGIIETRQGTVIEILPKIDLANVGTDGSADSAGGRHERTRKVFLTMLRDWRGLSDERSVTQLVSARSTASTCSKPSSTCS